MKRKFSIFLMSLMLMIMSSALVSANSFDPSSASSKDDWLINSINDENVSIDNSTGNLMMGRSQESLHLNGNNSYIRVEETPDLNLGDNVDNLNMSIDFKITDDPTPDKTINLISKGEINNPNQDYSKFFLHLTPTGDDDYNIRFYGDGGDLDESAAPGLKPNVKYELDVVLREDGQFLIYLDNELIRNLSGKGPYNLSTTEDLNIGSINFGEDRFFEGYIYRTSIINNGETILNFTEDTLKSVDSDTLSDSSGFSHDGTLVNASYDNSLYEGDSFESTYESEFIKYRQTTEQVADYGGWTIHNYPNVLEHNGVVYVTSVSGIDGNLSISSFDAITGEKLETNNFDQVSIDDHNNPSLIVDDDDHIVLSYARPGSNAGEPSYQHFGPINVLRSDEPENISSFTKVFESDYEGHTYSGLVYHKGDLYLSARGQIVDGERAFILYKSEDNGLNWTDQKMNLDWEQWKDAEDSDYGPYPHMVSDGDVIHMVAADVRVQNMYGWYLNGSDFYNYDDELIGDLDSEEGVDMENLTVIVNSSDHDGHPMKNYDILEKDGKVHVAFYEDRIESYFENENESESYNARRATWDGNDWSYTDVIAEMGGPVAEDHYYDPGLALDRTNPDIMYIGVNTDTNTEIRKYQTYDDGESWVYSDVYRAPSNMLESRNRDDYKLDNKNFWPKSIHGKTEDTNINVIWRYGRYTDFIDYNNTVYGSFDSLPSDVIREFSEFSTYVENIPSGSDAKIKFYSFNSTSGIDTPSDESDWFTLSEGENSISPDIETGDFYKFEYDLSGVYDNDDRLQIKNYSSDLGSISFIVNLPLQMDVYDKSDDSNIFGKGQNENIKGIFKRDGKNIFESNLMFEGYDEDLDMSGVTAENGNSTVNDTVLGRAVIDVPSNLDDRMPKSSRYLYVPAEANTGQVYICPNAETLSDVNEDCSDIEYRLVDPEDGYYKVQVSGTGVGETDNFPLPSGITTDTYKACQDIAGGVRDSFTLGTIVLLVLAATAIITIMTSAFGGGVQNLDVKTLVVTLTITSMLFIIGVFIFEIILKSICG